MVVFADLQCPYCKIYDVEINPTIIRTYVRTGKIRLYFSGMDFVGKDSNRGLKAAAAAAAQNRLWNVINLLYVNQGRENAGWLSDKMITAVAKATPGLDLKRFDSDHKGKAIDARMKNWQALAAGAGVDSTPTFFVGRPGKLAPLQVSQLQASQFTAALDKLVKST